MSSSADGVSKDKKTHGISESYSPESKIDESLEELKRDGYTILRNIFSRDECETAKLKIDEIYKKQVEEFGGEKNLEYINDQNVARALFVYDDFFLKFLANDNILSILENSFGKKYILNLQNSPINKPYDSHYGSTWHRDLSYQHFVPSRPVAINVLICLNDFTEKNGGTHILPGSHRFEMFPSKNYINKNEKQIIASVGDAFIFDSLLFHRAGANNTDEERKLLVHMFTLPFVKQQINYPNMLNGKHIENPKLSYLLGYDSETENTILDWRNRRKKRYDLANKK